ncbi:MAG TPA: tetratricopeptide repeat protein [Vicinamibacterales bacterium]|nr:tetratricopeptide repeat protein [Vicinamibacterales bacterium]
MRVFTPFVAATAAALVAAAGCSGGPSEPAATPATVTFYRDVQPILYANCARCHRPGEAAPFSLLTYADAAGRADEIVEQTQARHMPPWLPEPGEFAFHGDRRLRAEQIATLQRWASAGAPEGNPADAPTPPVFPAGWQSGTPDLVLTPERAYAVKAGSGDTYRNLVVRTRLTAGAFVRAVEFKTNGAPIHHAVIRVDRTSSSRRRDGEDGQPGFDGMNWQPGQDPDGHFIGWAPGSGPIVSAEGMPWRIERGDDLVIEVHAIPTAKALTIQPTVGLFFTPTPPVRSPVTVRMGVKLIDIPAGQADYAVTDTWELPVAVTLLSIYPHAHYLGKEMIVTAAPPGGVMRTLIHIKQWSFHWQQAYRFVTPVALPRGTVLSLRYTYDNSAQNAENPHHPPQRVRAGPKSTDEMADLGLQMLTGSRDETQLLMQSFAERDTRANIEMAEQRVRESPANADYRAALGGTYVEVGRFAEALPHLEAALRLKAKNADLYNNLGIVLMEQRRLPEALTHFQRAVTLSPRDERLFFNLGNVLGAMHRPAESETAFNRSLAINPDYPDAHNNLADLLMSQRRIGDALAHYARAVELNPDSAIIENNYGGALGSARRYAEALRHVQRALQIDPSYAPARDNLEKLRRLGVGRDE